MSLVAVKEAISTGWNTLRSKKGDKLDASHLSEHSPLLGNPRNGSSTGSLVDALHQGSVTTASSSDNASNSHSSFSYYGNDPNLGIFGKVDPRVMSDAIIGLSDGLTVPFALTAGLSSLGNSKLVITGGLAELVSGAISMGLGGYLAAKSESQYYDAQVGRERQMYFDSPEILSQELQDIIIDMGASIDTASMLIGDLSEDPKMMIDFIIKYGRGFEEPAKNRQIISALTIGSGYFFGGFIPLIPYFFTTTVGNGLFISVIVMLVTLFWFGYFKAKVSMGPECTTTTCISEGFQMILVGSLAAGSAWLLVEWIDS